MAERKTAQNDGDVEKFIASVEDETKRQDFPIRLGEPCNRLTDPLLQFLAEQLPRRR